MPLPTRLPHGRQIGQGNDQATQAARRATVDPDRHPPHRYYPW
jgi:hypothetical protein